jgi:uncharacterized membrane protein YheB (UPF0754 family)
MTFLGLTWLEWVAPIAIGVVAGLATNAVALWMLFHPYRPVRLGPLQVLPMGAIPKEIDRIARRIGETVGRELLTPEDIARQLSSPAFRDRFDETLRRALEELLAREYGSLRELATPAQLAELEVVLDRLLGRLQDAITIYLRSPEFDDRLRGFVRSLGTDLRDRPLSLVLTPSLHADLLSGARELWGGVRESAEVRRAVAEAVGDPIERVLVSEKPLRHYLPAGAIDLGEQVVSRYLPVLLERLSEALADEETRAHVQEVLRRFVDRFLEEQRTWARIVGRMVVTERTLERTLRALEEGGVDEITRLLGEPTVRERVARAVNEGVEELLDRPVSELVGDISPERAERIRQLVTDRIVYMIRHPNAEAILVRRLDGLLTSAEGKTVGEALDLVGAGSESGATAHLADWALEALRGERSSALLDRLFARQSAWLLSVPIGRVADYLPRDATRRAERVLFDPLWEFIQRRVPAAVMELPIATIVEQKIRGYPIERFEAIVRRVSQRELRLIIHLGGFLGAFIGSLMLFTASWRAGALAAGTLILLSFVFLNVAGRKRAAP